MTQKIESEKVECKIEIKEVATGDIIILQNRQYVTDLDIKDNIVNCFMWEDGNYSCDCNRHNFFMQVKHGLKPLEAEDIACGDSRYKIRITRLDTNEEVYSEFS